MNPLHNNEQPIAIESFTPNLNELFKQRFSNLLVKLDHTLYYKRAAIIQEELSYIYDNYDNDLDALKYCATLSVLIDLSQQGWLLDIQETGLTLKMENDNLDDKAKIRYRLSAERNAQFKQESVKAFIRTMETEKTYNNHDISVKVLIGDKNFLIDAINNNRRICDPYIQQVSNQRDIFTGYKLSDIWRYFRYTWSIPYKTMPGRNLFYLVRDRLQPFHPVIGIFALGNSVLNLTVRDDDIGWTVDAIKRNMNIQTNTTSCENTVSGTLGKKYLLAKNPSKKPILRLWFVENSTQIRFTLYYYQTLIELFQKYMLRIWGIDVKQNTRSRNKLTVYYSSLKSTQSSL